MTLNTLEGCNLEIIRKQCNRKLQPDRFIVEKCYGMFG